MNISKIIHLPDLLFVQLCEKKFGVNRGVYNTIDSWLFNYGITDIIVRRSETYFFLTEVILDKDKSSNGKIKIGHGNLSKELNNYYSSKIFSEVL